MMNKYKYDYKFYNMILNLARRYRTLLINI